MALANGYQPATALLLAFCAKFALAFAQRVTTGGGDYKQVAESLHVPPQSWGVAARSINNMYVYGKPTKS